MGVKSDLANAKKALQNALASIESAEKEYIAKSARMKAALAKAGSAVSFIKKSASGSVANYASEIEKYLSSAGFMASAE
jgi:hypothetical protein